MTKQLTDDFKFRLSELIYEFSDERELPRWIIAKEMELKLHALKGTYKKKAKPTASKPKATKKKAKAQRGYCIDCYLPKSAQAEPHCKCDLDKGRYL